MVMISAEFHRDPLFIRIGLGGSAENLGRGEALQTELLSLIN
jgi:hypothetical protein